MRHFGASRLILKSGKSLQLYEASKVTPLRLDGFEKNHQMIKHLGLYWAKQNVITGDVLSIAGTKRGLLGLVDG